jgi:hypothetical protein
LSFLNQQQAELMATLTQPPPLVGSHLPASPVGYGAIAPGLSSHPGGFPYQQPQQRQPLPAPSAHRVGMDSMGGGGSSGGDASRDPAYRQFIALQAKEIEQRRAGAEKDKGKRREARTSDDRPAAPLGGADTYSDAHQIARQLAPTIPVQRHSDDVELATAVLSVVGNAIRDRIRGKPRAAKGKEADGAPTADAGGKKRSKKKGKKGSSPKSSSRPGSGERGGGGAAGSSGDHLPASASADHLPRAAREAEVRRVLSDVLASLAGYDTRLALPLFAQQLQMLNRRFGQPSDPAQIEALFGVAQRGGCVEMAEFLRRESTVHYFCLDLHSA